MPKAANITILEMKEPEPYIYMDLVGSYADIRLAGDHFPAFRHNPSHPRFSIWLDDPEVVAESDLKSRSCMLLENGEEVPPGHFHDVLPAGKYVKLAFTGTYDRLPEAWHFLLGLWLPHSGERAKQGVPGFEVYRNILGEVEDEDLVTDLYFALV